MGRTRQMLTDVLALLPGGPAAARGDVRAEYLALLAVLAHVCEIAGDVDAALGWHLRLLEDDPSNEDAHLGVVTTLALVGSARGGPPPLPALHRPHAAGVP